MSANSSFDAKQFNIQGLLVPQLILAQGLCLAASRPCNLQVEQSSPMIIIIAQEMSVQQVNCVYV